MDILLVPARRIRGDPAQGDDFARVLSNVAGRRVHVFTDQIKTLQELRCAQEILLPLAASIRSMRNRSRLWQTSIDPTRIALS
jgi:hypothetical protein